ncbi:protein argonaute 16 isoform X1 [Salvia miltiorrhiza]|uniref:protein argonaute 16 isoform X1 n=1 Tax=Salvia miltiorrhiza TaxID=226208 RepID=UPI0025AC0C47|nr:protein argonaute 16 isoform X1 [Salvia miltiorrhiza]XP_057792715.1 protein argonaute 16 isoform X1 [Salvia miltiorrhiza]
MEKPPPLPTIQESLKVEGAESADLPERSIMIRPGFGTSGKRVPLLANHFKVSIKNPNQIFYQYSVSISYEDNKAVDGKVIGRKVIDKLYQTYSSEFDKKRFAYDGDKSLFTVGPLPQNKFEYTVILEESTAKSSGNPSDNGCSTEPSKKSKHSLRSKTFKVEISYAAKIPLKSLSLALKGAEIEYVQDALRVLDIILRQQAAKRGCLLVRQSFFHDDPLMFTDVGGGVTGVRGLHSSFRPTLDGLSLNMDVSTTMILKPGRVEDFLLANQNVKDPRYIDWAKAKKMLKNMRVKAIHNNKEFKIIGLSEKPCNQQFFSLKVKSGSNAGGSDEALEITVYDYFVKHRNIELKSSSYMPCLDVGKPKRPNYLPLELCSLVSLQRYTKALSVTQRSSLVEKSRQKPLERIRVVTDAMTKYKYDEDPLLVSCGISIEKQLTQLDGRILDAPKLKVGNNEDFSPRNGRWNFNNKKLLKPQNIEEWALVNFSGRCDSSHLSRELINCARSKGIEIERPYTIIEEDPQCRRASPVVRVEKMFEHIMAKLPGPPQFLLCVLPERKNCDIYGPWKKKCLSNMGIVTQCISPIKINDQYLTNVLLKINSKLGGTNSLLAIEHSNRIPLVTDQPTMILGMDVSHGSPGRSDVPSIAAVVGSRSWPLISKYRAAVRAQSAKVEMIESLFKPLANGQDDGIMRELLLDFYQTSNGRKPTQIIVFRDGVSESQFTQVINIELDQMIKAYQHLGESAIPKFTVIVAQKNHHTKLFQASAQDNVPCGTVVDTKIVHPRNYDFYMCSQAGLIGTSRPAHYHVLLDEIGFSPDALQNLIHSLSYIYQRSTTAISIVAPVCYAHLAAHQVGQFMKFEDLSETSSGQNSMTATGSIPIPELPRLHKDVAGSMFFC